MRQKLFPNLQKMSTFFCVGIIAITFMTLTLRLTLLSGMAIVPPVPPNDDQSQPAADGSGLLYQINPKVYFPAPDAKGNIYIANLDTNTEYIRVDLKLLDTGRSIYYSGDISPGTTINSVKLQGEPLKVGVYDCVATITAYDPVTRDKLGSEEEPVKVYIGQKP